MNLILLLFLVVAVVLIWFWVAKPERKPKNENPVYVCPECGDLHCNCYLEEKDE